MERGGRPEGQQPGRLSRRVFVARTALTGLTAAGLTRIATARRVMAEGASAPGNANLREAPLRLRVLPAPVWIERIRGRQRLSFDLLVQNDDTVEWTLKFIGLRVFEQGKIIWTRRLDYEAVAPSIATLGDTAIPPQGQLYLFNPFPSFDSTLPLGHLRCSLLLSTSAGAHAIRAVDIHPKPYQQHTPLQLPLQGRILADEGHDYYAAHRRVPLFIPQ